MPKFVSGTSGNIYAHGKSSTTSKKNPDDEDETSDINALIGKTSEQLDSDGGKNKPSAINKKGTKEKQKNSLDLFKEELKRLQEERDEQRNKSYKRIARESNLDDKTSSTTTKTTTTSEQSSSSSNVHKSSSSQSSINKPLPVPIPLKPDPRCPTTLTLKVNLNPKGSEASVGGSFDNGDPTTTNLYLGNVNPTVNENDLCDIFGKFGPLASIKIMWPRTDEERARNRNSGFVAYMSRIDADRALRALNGKDFHGYDMKLGWGKAVPIPQNPVYVPPELAELTLPPPKSGLPFNAQLSSYDIERGYVVPNPYPRPIPAELESNVSSNAELASQKKAYEDFMEVLSRATIKVILPTDRDLLDRIHKTIECVIKEGPVFEAIIIARENKNSSYSFLYDNNSLEHIYYRWKLYSILHGDDPYEWRTEEFKMFEGGSTWKPPSLNPYADGMPLELVEKSTADILIDPTSSNTKAHNRKSSFFENSISLMSTANDSRLKGSLGKVKKEMLGDLLRNLNPTRAKIGESMLFCINHSDAAQEVIDCIHESLSLIETPFQKKLARLFLVSDVLHNHSASVTNASYYRKGFQSKLISIFEHLREYLVNIEDHYKADKFKQKVLNVLGAWKEWTLYEDEFIIKLSDILLGIRDRKEEQANVKVVTSLDETDSTNQQKVPSTEQLLPSANKMITKLEDDLDGEELDDEMLGKFLEARGLSLRWYKTLDLSDDETEEAEPNEDTKTNRHNMIKSSLLVASDELEGKTIRFKTSKWETVDPNEVAGQVVTISKCEAMAAKEVEGEDDSSDEEEYVDSEKKAQRLQKLITTDSGGKEDLT